MKRIRMSERRMSDFGICKCAGDWKEEEEEEEDASFEIYQEDCGSSRPPSQRTRLP